MLVANEGRMRLGGVFLQPEGAGAVEIALESAGVIRRQNDCVEIIRRYQVGETAVRRIELKLHGVVASHRRATFRERAGEGRQGDGAVLWIGEPVHGRHHIGRGQRAPVMELDAAANLERPDAAIRVRQPALRERRLQLKCGVGNREIFPGLGQQTDAAGVGHGERIDQARRHRHPNRHRGARAHRRARARGRECAEKR